jgi:hypothetical protein
VAAPRGARAVATPRTMESPAEVLRRTAEQGYLELEQVREARESCAVFGGCAVDGWCGCARVEGGVVW